tara:strand:+ start:75927 stop:76151 length:225 start_codon:yes stop_codon:yes gene_type:complete
LSPHVPLHKELIREENFGSLGQNDGGLMVILNEAYNQSQAYSSSQSQESYKSLPLRRGKKGLLIGLGASSRASY